MSHDSPGTADPALPRELETTAALLALIRQGDAAARERLVRRYLPILRRWARGRLPAAARDLAETDDLVQLTLIRALSHVKDFEPRFEGAFLSYLRRALLNSVRDEIRRVRRRPRREPLDPEMEDPRPSVVEQAIGREALERYEAALAELPEDQREAVILRLEFGFTHQEVADALGKPSSNAARMMVARAVVRVVEVMDESSG
jgi:RNA polymerase sigma-70 factor, ECF subfamily